MGELRGTTIVAVRRDGRYCAVAGDGQGNSREKARCLSTALQSTQNL